VTSKLPDKDDLTGLDIGTTSYSGLLNNIFSEADVHTVNIGDKYQPRMHAEGVSFKTCDISEEELPYSDGTFDAVFFTEVLEHLFGSPYEVFDKIARVIRQSGVLVFGTPNILRLKNRIKFGLGSNPQGVNLSADYFAHVREYSMDECELLLSEYGFSIEMSDYVIFHDLGEFIKWNSGEGSGWSKWLLIPLSIVYYTMCSVVPILRTYLYFKTRRK